MTANAASGLLWVSESARIYRLCCRCSSAAAQWRNCPRATNITFQQTSPFGQNSSAALAQLNQAIDGDVALPTCTLALSHSTLKRKSMVVNIHPDPSLLVLKISLLRTWRSPRIAW